MDTNPDTTRRETSRHQYLGMRNETMKMWAIVMLVCGAILAFTGAFIGAVTGLTSISVGLLALALAAEIAGFACLIQI